LAVAGNLLPQLEQNFPPLPVDEDEDDAEEL
jgi:hypothetical protein